MGLFDTGTRPGVDVEASDRILTVPNLVTLLRLLGLPVFVYLLVGLDARWVAFWTLVVIAATDWVDGYLARRLGQVSKLGTLVDPLVDRVLLAVAGVTLVLDGALPLVVLVLFVARDVVLLATAYVLFRGIPDIPVVRTGKTATAALLVAVPGFLLASIDWPAAEVLHVGAWGIAGIGIVLYYVAGIQYAVAAKRIRAQR